MKVKPIRNSLDQPMWEETVSALTNALNFTIGLSEPRTCPNVLGEGFENQTAKRCKDELPCNLCWKISILKKFGLEIDYDKTKKE